MICVGFPGGTVDKDTICQCRRHMRCGSDPWVRKIPWSRKWQPTPGFLPGKFYVHGIANNRTHIHSHTHKWYVQGIQHVCCVCNVIYRFSLSKVMHNNYRKFGLIRYSFSGSWAWSWTRTWDSDLDLDVLSSTPGLVLPTSKVYSQLLIAGLIIWSLVQTPPILDSSECSLGMKFQGPTFARGWAITTADKAWRYFQIATKVILMQKENSALDSRPHLSSKDGVVQTCSTDINSAC